MIPIKLLINSFLFLTVLLFAGCVGKTGSEPAAGSPEIVNRLVANNITPADFQSRTQSIITLSYTSIDKDLATSCTLSRLANVTVTQACSCDGVGVCNVGVTGVAAYTGAGSFSYNLVAGGKTSTTGKASFNITAPPAGSNVPPTIQGIGLKETDENVPTPAISFTIGDSDSVVTCSDVTATSTNTALIPVANIVITGSAPTCYVTITPVAHLVGSSNIVLTLTDKGTPLPAQTATSSFTLNVNPVNDAPTISAIAPQTTPEDTALTPAASFTIADIDSVIACTNVTAVSSNTSLVSNNNITITGTAPNCKVSAAPNLNQSGTTDITLTVTDNGSPVKTASTVMALTVAAVNDPPVVSAISGQSTTQNVAKAVSFTISDVDSTLTCAGSVLVTSSNTTLVPNTNIVVSGTAPNCTATITPANNQSGSTTMSVKVTDNGSPLPAKSTTNTFVLTVAQVNLPPTISTITTKTTNEDTATSAIAFTIADSDAAIYCTNVVGTSSNTTVVPNANIVITGTAPNCSVKITPAANQFGSVTITLTVTDNGTPLPAQTATSVFILNVTAVNDAPTISAITNKSTDEDTASSAIAFTIADVDSNLSCSGSVAGTSSNTTIIPNANIVISGAAPNCSAVITPAANQNGSATITLKVTDNGTPTPALTATSVFTMTVTPVVDISGTLSLTNNVSGVASSYAGSSYGRTMNFTGITADEAITTLEICLGTAAGSCDVSSWVDAVGYTSSGSAPTVSLGGSYKMKSGSGGAQVFTLTPSCSSTTDYYYSVRATNSSSRISNVLSTPAWSFWEPTCLGSLVLAQWLDASEASTITTATGVSNWTDKSGNARTVTQATGAKQPSYSASGLGAGLPGVIFNGTSSVLARNSFIYAQGSSSIFTTIKGSAVTSNKYIVSEGRTASATNYYAPMLTSTTSTITAITVNNTATELNLPVTSSVLFDGTIKLSMTEDSGSSFFSYSDGVAQSQAATSYTRGTSTIDTYRLGARFRSAAEGLWFSGTIGEFIVTNGILSTLQRQKLEGYSAHKWGVSGNLPVAHPYSTTPP